MFGTISSKKIAILGFSFKANTNDTRITSNKYLSKTFGRRSFFKDIRPKVKENQIIKELGLNENHKGDREWDYSIQFIETFKDVDAALFLTEWNEFASLNWEEISKMMRQPSGF